MKSIYKFELVSRLYNKHNHIERTNFHILLKSKDI